LVGADLFFVLSGFLLGGILIDHRHSDAYFAPFYTSRLDGLWRDMNNIAVMPEQNQ